MDIGNNYAPGVISVDQFKQSMPTPPAPQQSQAIMPQVAPQHSGNWFTHLLPTIGGTVLPWVIGAALAPETGGLSLLGSAAASGVGAAAGKAAENATEGKQVLNGSDLTAGLEGAGGALAGGALGGLLSKGSNMLEGQAGKLAADAEQAATQKTAQEAEIAAEQATRNNYNISDKLKGGNHLALGTNQKFLTIMGYDATDPYQMAKAAEVGYHPTDLSYNGIYDEALQNAKPVDMSNFGNDVYKTMQQSGTTDLSTSPLGKALQDFHNRTGGIYNAADNAGIQLPQDMSAADVRKLQQAVGREVGHQQTIINAAENSGAPNIAAESAHSTLSNLYDQLGSKIKTPEVDHAIAARVTTPEERAALVAKFGDKLGNHAADTIDQAQNADALLKPMQQTTQMGKLGELGIDNLENKTGTTASIARAKANAVTNAPAAAPTSTLNKMADGAGALGMLTGHPVAGLIPLISHVLPAASKAADNPAVLETLARMGKLGAKLAPTAGVIAGTSPNLAAGPVAGAGIPGGVGMEGTNGTMGNNMQQSPMDELYQTLLAHIHATGGLGANDGAITSVLAALAPQVQKNHLLATQMGGMNGLYENAGGAQGLGGFGSQISSLIPGTAANRYESAVHGLQPQLQQAGINPALLPQLMNNGQSAGLSQGILGQLGGQLAY